LYYLAANFASPAFTRMNSFAYDSASLYYHTNFFADLTIPVLEYKQFVINRILEYTYLQIPEKSARHHTTLFKAVVFPIFAPFFGRPSEKSLLALSR
jgi:hypothetical protein